MRTSHAALFLLISCATLRADRVAPRPKPTDYPARVTVGPLDIAADYLVHSFFGSEHDQMFFTADFLVVEVAFYPDSGRTYRVDTPKFSLRLNGKKGVLFPESPDTVAYTLKYADADRRPRVEAGAGRGDVMVAVGAPARVPRFPGDPTGGEYPQRQSPRVPDTTDPNVPKSVSATVDQVIKQTALEDGEKSGAVAGYLFFAYRENVKKIKSVELLYDDATGGIATLRLR